MEAISTEEGLTLSHLRKTSVTGITHGNSKNPDKSPSRNKLTRPQTAKHFSRPKSSDADSFGKA